jgi:hypothetical protein
VSNETAQNIDNSPMLRVGYGGNAVLEHGIRLWEGRLLRV